MDAYALTFIVGLILELASIHTIVRLWQKRRMKIIPRIMMSLVLLIPFFGFLIYIFIGNDVDRNSDGPDGHSDSDAFLGDGGGHH